MNIRKPTVLSLAFAFGQPAFAQHARELRTRISALLERVEDGTHTLANAGVTGTFGLGLDMGVAGFSHYNLRAQRAVLDELCTFYRDVVGLVPGERPPFRSFGYWLYAGSQPILHLSEAAPGEDRSSAGATTFDHAAFDCRDRAEFERKLGGRGIEYRVAQVPQTGLVQLFFRDPAGNGVELNFPSVEA